MQAADFLGCKAVKKNILQHLQTALNEVIDRGTKAAAYDTTTAVQSLEVHESYIRDWHNVQV